MTGNTKTSKKVYEMKTGKNELWVLYSAVLPRKRETEQICLEDNAQETGWPQGGAGAVGRAEGDFCPISFYTSCVWNAVTASHTQDESAVPKSI